MTPGLPGTGIGGLFYILLALLMPFVGIGRILLGRGDGLRWRPIAAQWVYACGILSVLAAEAWVLGRAVSWLEPSGQSSVAGGWWDWRRALYGFHVAATRATAEDLSAVAAYVTFSTLVAVLLGVHLLRLVLRLLDRGAVNADLIDIQPAEGAQS